MINLPNGDLVAKRDDGLFYGTNPFMTFLKNMKDGVNSPVVPSGTTAERPTRYIFVGTLYLDLTLNKLITVTALNPTVWRDGAGAVV